MEDELLTVIDHAISTMELGESRLYEQVNSTFTWLLATLFAAHGGGILALLNLENVSSKTSLALFAGGIISTILMGGVNAGYATKALMITTDITLTMKRLAAGHASLEEFNEQHERLNGITWIKWVMYGIGAASFALLIAGMVTFGCAL